MNETKIFSAFLVLTLGIALFGCTQATPTIEPPTATITVTPSPTPLGTATPNPTGTVSASPTAALRVIKMSEIATHAVKGDCWLLIDGNVIDVSDFTRHPGGDAYVPYCGKDASEAFHSRPGDGTDHSARAKSSMMKMQIGTLG